MAQSSVRRAVTARRVQQVNGGRTRERPDQLVTEEPMEVRVQGPNQNPEALAVTMRTPGADFELAVGLCRTEGVLTDAADLAGVAYCLEGEAKAEQHYNVVTVTLRHPVDLEPLRRRLVANASCGVCGKTTLDQVEADCPPVAPGTRVTRAVILSLPGLLRDAQSVFDATGGLHAAARFDADGQLLAVREDVGRHNALDKLIGHAVLDDALPLSGEVLLVSGRVSFEIVQKAAVAGIPVICAVSAPSSLAVQAADRLGQTVVGFLRDTGFNVYSHPDRIDLE